MKDFDLRLHVAASQKRFGLNFFHISLFTRTYFDFQVVWIQQLTALTLKHTCSLNIWWWDVQGRLNKHGGLYSGVNVAGLMFQSSLPFQERTRCSWTSAGRKRWKTSRPWEPERAALCWARLGPSSSPTGCCCSALAWRFLSTNCCRGSNVSAGAPWRSARRHRGFKLLIFIIIYYYAPIFHYRIRTRVHPLSSHGLWFRSIEIILQPKAF